MMWQPCHSLNCSLKSTPPNKIKPIPGCCPQHTSTEHFRPLQEDLDVWVENRAIFRDVEPLLTSRAFISRTGQRTVLTWGPWRRRQVVTPVLTFAWRCRAAGQMPLDSPSWPPRAQSGIDRRALPSDRPFSFTLYNFRGETTCLQKYRGKRW